MKNRLAVLVVVGVAAVALLVVAMRDHSSTVELYGYEPSSSMSLSYRPAVPQQQMVMEQPNINYNPQQLFYKSPTARKPPTETLAEQDEALMENKEDEQAAKATAAIRADLERAKSESARTVRQEEEKKQSENRPSFPPLYSAAALRKAIDARRAADREETAKELAKTFRQLAAAVGSAPSDGRQRHMIVSPPRVSLAEEDDDQGHTMHKSMMRMQDKAKARLAARFVRQEQVQELAQLKHSKMEQERRRADHDVDHDRFARQARQQYRMMRAIRERKQRQALAAVASETGEEAQDIKPEWKAFTAVERMHPRRTVISSKAKDAVDQLIGDDLI